jgi:hypothetical protein
LSIYWGKYRFSRNCRPGSIPIRRQISKSKRPSLHWTRVVRILLVLAVAGYVFYSAQQRQRQRQLPARGPVAIDLREEQDRQVERVIVPNVKITYEDDGRIVTWQGDVDLTATVGRIRRGERLDRWEHDGDVFGNFERRLPAQRRGYYREWIHPTPHAPGPGPQRVISGEAGDLWYTPDHYQSFIELPDQSAAVP